MTEKNSRIFQFFGQEQRSNLSDAAISVLLDVENNRNSNVRRLSKNSDADVSYWPGTENDVNPKLLDADKLIEVQLAWGDHSEQDAAGDHGPGHQLQLQTDLSCDKDGGGEPSKSAKSKRYIMVKC